MALACALALAGAGGLAGWGAPAAAQAPRFSNATVSRQERDDTRIVSGVWNAVTRNGVDVIRNRREALEQVLSRAPASYPVFAQREGRAHFRLSGSADPDNGTIASAVRATAPPGSREVRIELSSNTYGLAAFLLALDANNSRDPERALQISARGLAFQPDNLQLINERGQALLQLRRWAEMYEVYDRALSLPAPASNHSRALIYKGRGFASVELGNLDAGEADARRALELLPNDRIALDSLDYIARLRAGGSTLPPDSIVTEEASPPRGRRLIVIDGLAPD